jgi:tetratricopeptide (TPR) repeat protein
MNKVIIVIVFLSLIFMNKAFPQSALERRGVKYYELYAYEDAASRLEQISEKSTDILRMLADSYFKIGKLAESQAAYADLMLRSDRIPEDIYQYAFVLAANKNYREAKRWMETYAMVMPDDSRVERYFTNPDFYQELMKDKDQFSIRFLEFNSKQSDFGAAFWENRIVFASTRPTLRPFQRLWSRNKLPFLNMYVATIDENGEFAEVEQFSKEMSNKYHDGPATFARDGTFMAFTRNNLKLQAQMMS